MRKALRPCTGVLAAASLTSFAALSINGKLYGLYIAIEDVSDSFLERNYGESKGALYKPETERLANAGGEGGIPGGNGMPDGIPEGGVPDGTQPPMPEGIMPPGGPGGIFPGGNPGTPLGVAPPGGNRSSTAKAFRTCGERLFVVGIRCVYLTFALNWSIMVSNSGGLRWAD